MSSWSSFASQVKHAKQKDDPNRRHGTKHGSKIKNQVPSRSDETSAGVNASSFLGLKAELAERQLAEGSHRQSRESSEVGILRKSEKKLPAFLRPSPGVSARSSKDARTTTSSWANTPSAQLEAARAAMEKKTKIYDKLKRGKTAGLDQQSLDESLIDWDRMEKAGNDDPHESYNMDQDEGGDLMEGEDEPMVEYEDEFGRVRKVPRSEVPREILREKERQMELDNQGPALYGAQSSFPVFKPPSPKIAESGYKREAPPHFDSSFEKRHRGAGFYQFSHDEETREKEMEELRRARDETEKRRRQTAIASNVTEDPMAQLENALTLSIGESRREDRRRYVEERKLLIESKKAKFLEEY